MLCDPCSVYTLGVLDNLVRRFVFPRPRSGVGEGPPPFANLEQHWLQTPEGKVEYWFLRSEGPGEARRPAVMFAHGNAELIDDWPEPLSRYGDLGVHLVLPEYRGYGRSAGRPTEASLTADWLAIAEEVSAREDVDDARLLFHGRSLGGGVVCAAASQRAPAALILQSTFTTLPSVAGRFGAPQWLVPDAFDNLACVSEVHCPCLIFHGDRDALIPVDHAHTLHESGNVARLRVFPGADHNTPIDRFTSYWEDIASLLNALDA